MAQTLVIHQKFLESLSKNDNSLELIKRGYNSADNFLNEIIAFLNDEFNFLNLEKYRVANLQEQASLSQYSAFVDGEILPFKKISIWFTPIVGKQGNVIIEQGVMPTVCSEMEKNIDFLINDQYKKILVMTSIINHDNKKSKPYSSLQLQVSSLNVLNFDVVQFFPIKDLAINNSFNSIQEYIDVASIIQKQSMNNAQVEYIRIRDSIVYGYFQKDQAKGQFIKSFCFKFLTAILIGGNNYEYNIEDVVQYFPNGLDNQLKNLHNFINAINKRECSCRTIFSVEDTDTIEYDDKTLISFDIHRVPERIADSTGRKRYKTQKKIKDYVLKEAKYNCNCHNEKHFYFESVEGCNYVEAHHIIPMNRQDVYYEKYNINLDNIDNIIPLCPNCHKQIHLGSKKSRLDILREIYARNEKKLKQLNPNLTFDILASYYNIIISVSDGSVLIDKNKK